MITQKVKGRCFVCGSKMRKLCTHSHDTPAGEPIETEMCDDTHACYQQAHENAEIIRRYKIEVT